VERGILRRPRIAFNSEPSRTAWLASFGITI
jgi:hypothetical protein